MLRYRLSVSIVLALAPAFALAQHAMPDKDAHDDKGASTGKAQAKPARSKMSASQKIAEAPSAAPTEISKNATIMDWPEKAGGQPQELRKGTNDWVCFPSSPTEFGAASQQDPMCLDKQWQGWGDAWMNKKPPNVTGTGIAYMLKGDKGASNKDPFATGPTPDNEWVVSPSHIMVLFPDPKMLDAFPTDPKSGGPWVMWKGTPYAHLMVPVAPKAVAKAGVPGATRSSK
jgi:hypothetical protein